jgi:hypothetical protein
MDNVESFTNATTNNGPSEEFELKMLDCGTNYQMDASNSTCLSCFCGSGCFCGTADQLVSGEATS